MSETCTKREPSSDVPVPRLAEHQAVDWFFCFKFDASAYPGKVSELRRGGLFGGERESYDDSPDDANAFSLAYCVASSRAPTLEMGVGQLGNSTADPVGATFDQIYRGEFYYLLWNDQFYGDPMNTEESPHGHSKGVLAWNEAGEGVVMQVSTPSWPASGSAEHPRERDGNTLGYINDDDIKVSQHVFTLALKGDDVQRVLEALVNARVVTNPKLPQLARAGGPKAITDLIAQLNARPEAPACTTAKLSSGVTLLSKPSTSAVPPWQMVSAQLGGVDLRVASWWAWPKIYSTARDTPVGCWDDALGRPGAVDIATTGTWEPVGSIGLRGGAGPGFNHAKFGVSTSGEKPYCIFGDMNQQGTLSCGTGKHAHACDASQNGRGGLFFVLEHAELHRSMSALLAGESARVAIPEDADGITDDGGVRAGAEPPKR